MIKYDISFTASAERDLDKIVEYISIDLLLPEIANKFLSKIKCSILTLEYFPKRYHILESSYQKSTGFRMMLVDNFSIIYVVDAQEVVVTHILYSASDLKEKIKL